MAIRLSCNKRIDDATWADVEAVLPELKIDAFFILHIFPEPEHGPVELEIQAENGYYMPFMLANGMQGRSFKNLSATPGEVVEICGYDCDTCIATQDHDRIVQMITDV